MANVILVGVAQAKAQEAGNQQDAHDLERLPQQDDGGNSCQLCGLLYAPHPGRSDNYHRSHPPRSWFAAECCP